MPTLVTEQGIVHYETYGRGRPVILLHGWLGSWALWRNTIEELGKEFKTYALDFLGFGDTYDQSADFSVNNLVELVSQFMDRLGIVKAPLIGHSMGGTVALGVATRYSSKVVKTVIIGSPIEGSSLNPFLKLSGNRHVAKLVFSMPVILDIFIMLLTRVGSREGKSIQRMVKADASKVSAESFFQSIGTLHKTNLTPLLPQIQTPILGIFGNRDIIVNPSQGKLLQKHAPNSREVFFENSGHFPMMDEPDRFYKLVSDFLKNG